MSKNESAKAKKRTYIQEKVNNILELFKREKIIIDYQVLKGNSIFPVVDKKIRTIIERELSNINVTDEKGRDVKSKFVDNLSKYAKTYTDKLIYPNVNVNAIITATDNKNYALFARSSDMRERFRNILWDSQILKQYALADYSILLHMQDEESDEKYLKDHTNLTNKLQKFLDAPRSINSLDEIISDEDFYWKFSNAYINTFKNDGAKNDARGKAFEEWLGLIFKDEFNLKRWNNPIKAKQKGFMYNIFNLIMSEFVRDRANKKISKIEVLVGNDIPPLLPSSDPKSHDYTRKPKTDVCIKIKYKSESNFNYYTISAKCSAGNYVSAHDYKVYDYIEALDLDLDENHKENDIALVKALDNFQDEGSYSDMDPIHEEPLKEGLKKHLKELYTWVVSGKCVNPDKYPYYTDEKIQIANYLVCYNYKTKELKIHTAEEYIDYLLKKKVNSRNGSGTVLAFTYPSGGKNHRIQLNIPLDWSK